MQSTLRGKSNSLSRGADAVQPSRVGERERDMERIQSRRQKQDRPGEAAVSAASKPARDSHSFARSASWSHVPFPSSASNLRMAAVYAFCVGLEVFVIRRGKGWSRGCRGGRLWL